MIRAFPVPAMRAIPAFLALWFCGCAAARRPALAAVNGRPFFENSIGMEFVYIQPGEFLMGSPEEEPGRFGDEDLHRVRITKGFYLGRFEVTRKEWSFVTAYRGIPMGGRERMPALGVTWDDAIAFCRALSEREGRRYRLPTEAEWEYACRAGTTTRFSFGDDAASLGAHAWHAGNSGDASVEAPPEGLPGGYRVLGGTPRPVGLKKPNAWGLHDMHGNVLEWCQDFYAAHLGRDDQADPKGPAAGGRRVLRGGSCWYEARMCRSADRAGRVPSDRGHGGLRLVLELEK